MAIKVLIIVTLECVWNSSVKNALKKPAQTFEV